MLQCSPSHLQLLLSWAPAPLVLGKADKCHGLQCHRECCGHIHSRVWSSSASYQKGRYDCKPRCAEGTGASFPQPYLPPCVSFPAASPQQSQGVCPWTSPGSCWQGRAEVDPALKPWCKQLSSAQPQKPDTVLAMELGKKKM